MKISGSSVLHAPPERVFAAITDPAVLAAVIPGCQALTRLDDGRFALTVTLGVASIKGSYAGEIAFLDLTPPSSLTLRANGSGGPGTIDTTVAVTLAEVAEGTRLDYDADAVVGGMVGGVGQRVLTGVAKKTAGAFFSAIDAQLTGAVAEPVATATGAPAGVAQAVPVPVGPVPVPQPYLLGLAAAIGAAAALVGVLVGVRIGRRG